MNEIKSRMESDKEFTYYVSLSFFAYLNSRTHLGIPCPFHFSLAIPSCPRFVSFNVVSTNAKECRDFNAKRTLVGLLLPQEQAPAMTTIVIITRPRSSSSPRLGKEFSSHFSVKVHGF